MAPPSDPSVGGTSAYSSAVVRLVYVTKGLRKIAGLGMLVGRKQVVTCAHVVNTALERNQTEQNRPADNLILTVEFPFVPDSPARYGTVVSWSSPPQSATGTGDIAGILLSEAAPAGCTPGRFTGRPSTESPLKVFGYPGVPLRALGRWVDVELKGEIGDLIQVESCADQTIKAQPGYGGSPVWQHDTGMAVGLLLHAAPLPDEPDRDACLFSAQHVANLWEDPFSYILIPDNPYRGLQAFTAEDAHLFFGRSRDIEQLAELIEIQPVAVVVGPSGVGKSSLIQAGLIPHLLQTPGWSALTMRPGADPLARLADQLVTVDRDRSSPVDRAALERTIAQLRADGLGSWAKYLRVHNRKLVVLIDQFEELLAADEPLDDVFLDLVFSPNPLANSPIRFVATLRADFLTSLLDIPGFGARIQRCIYPVSPLTDNELRDAVEQPATARGVRYEAGLVEQLVEDATSDALPLLQFTVTHLWETQHRKTLSFSGYYKIGRVTGALDRFAEQQVATLPQDVERALNDTLLHLIRTPRGAPGLTVRRRAREADLTQSEWQVARRLADARLAIVGRIGDASYVELAHEALLTSWQRLQRLVREEAEFLGWLTKIEQRARDGDALPESRIPEARRWLDTRPTSVPPRVRAFIEHSESAAAARRAEQSRAEIAEQARERAVQVSLSLRLASEARQAIPLEGETALLVAWEAVLCDRNNLTEAVFREALENMPAAVQVLRAPTYFAMGEVSAGFVDAHTVLIADSTSAAPTAFATESHARLTVYDLRNGESRTAQIQGDGILDVTVLPPVGAVMTTGRQLRLLETTGETIDSLTLPEVADSTMAPHLVMRAEPSHYRHGILVRQDDWYFKSAVSSDHRLAPLIQVRLDTSPERLRLDPTGEFLITQTANEFRVWNFSSDGHSLTEYSAILALWPRASAEEDTGGEDGSVSWRLIGSMVKALSTEPRYHVDTLAFDPAGRGFAITAGGTVDLWSHNGILEMTVPAEPGTRAIAYSANGSTIATAETRIQLWGRTTSTAQPPMVLHGHRKAVNTIAFHPDDPSVVLSVDRSGEVRLWRVAPHRAIASHRGNPRLRTAAGWTVCSDAATTTAIGPERVAVSLEGFLLELENSIDDRAFALVVDKHHKGRLWEFGLGSRPRCYGKIQGNIYRTQHDTRYVLAPDGQHLLQISRGLIALQTASGATVANFRTHSGRLVVSTASQGVASGELRLPAERPAYGSNDTMANADPVVAFRADGRMLVVALVSGDVGIFGVNGECLAHFEAVGLQDGYAPIDIACDPRCEFLIVFRPWAVGAELWDWQGRFVRALDTQGGLPSELSVSPNGQQILVKTAGRGYQVFDREGSRVAAFERDGLGYLDVIDASGRYLAFFDDGSLAILDWTGESLARLAGPFGTHVRGTAYSQSGDLVAVLFDDSTIRVWNAPERRHVLSMRLPGVTAIALSGDERMLLVASTTGDVVAYPLDVEDLFGTAAQRVSRPLSPEELERFGIDSARLDSAILADFLSQKADR